jgi:hypothetical protein
MPPANPAALNPSPDGTPNQPPPPRTAAKAEKPKEKKGLFRRLFGVFK